MISPPATSNYMERWPKLRPIQLQHHQLYQPEKVDHVVCSQTAHKARNGACPGRYQAPDWAMYYIGCLHLSHPDIDIQSMLGPGSVEEGGSCRFICRPITVQDLMSNDKQVICTSEKEMLSWNRAIQNGDRFLAQWVSFPHLGHGR